MALLATLTDDFATPPLNPAKWTFNGVGTATVSGETLNITSANSAIAVVSSATTYTFTNSYVLAKVSSTLGANNYVLMEVAATKEKFVVMLGNDVFFLGYNDAGTLVRNVDIPYNATTMRWLRMRHTSGTVYWETSPDGLAWTVRASWIYTPAEASHTLRLSTQPQPTTSLTAVFDDINIPPPVNITAAPTGITNAETIGGPALTFTASIEALTDDFNTPPLDAGKWVWGGGDGTYTVSGGTLNLIITSPAIGSQIDSTSTYQFANSYILAKVTPGAVGSGQVTTLAIRDSVAAQESLYIFVDNATLYVRGTNSAGTMFCDSNFAYNATQMAWWRIRHSSGVVYWETSPDTYTWTARAQTSYTPTSTAFRARFFTNRYSGGSFTSTFDNVNILPPYIATVAPTEINDTEAIGDPAVFIPPRLTATLVDDFRAGLDTTIWNVVTNNGNASVSGGFLRLGLTTNNASSEVVTKLNNWVLANSTFYLKINPTRTNNLYSELVIEAANGRYVRIRYTNTSNQILLTALNDAGSTVISTGPAYDANTWAYWRVRHSGTTLYVDRSPDGINWTQNSQGAGVSTWVTAVKITVRLVTVNTSNTPPHVLTVDSMNMVGTGSQIEVAPDPAADTETLGAPQLAEIPTTPDPIADAETLTPPDLTFVSPVEPDNATDPETLGDPSAGQGFTANPEFIQDFETLAEPNLVTGDFHRPDSLNDTETLDGPEIQHIPDPSSPDTLTDSETLDGPQLELAPTRFPDTLEETEQFGEPVLPANFSGHPGGATDTEQFDTIYIGFQAATAYPGTITDPQTQDPPDITYHPGIVSPAGIAHQETLGAPAATFIATYNGNYSTGQYGVGPYQGLYFSPYGIIDPQTLAEPDILTLPPVPTDVVLPIGIIDGETLDGPQLPRLDANNILYGQGTYNDGPYYGDLATPTDDNPTDNVTYSYGTYGYGIYYGQAVPVPPDENIPQYRDIAGRTKPPLHILGIGPWSPYADWRGAKNYGINPGQRPSRPAMALPPATGKGFVLRLNDGGEARCDLAFPRGAAIILDEMDTDLWWRRKDPRTGILEMIGRFNTAHLSVATTDTGVTCSAQFVDYSTVLGERMILKYLNPLATPDPTSMWDQGTPITDIIAWALPANTGLDLSEVDNYDLGKAVVPFHLPPGTLVSDFLDNVEAVSPAAWEWWIETPTDINKAPKLRFKVGERGADKGVVLFDHGTGPTPIASWTRNSAADDYANSIYYTGGGSGTGADAGGGVVEEIAGQIRQYGQRDVQDGNSSLGGDVVVMRQRAIRKLQKYADRRPNYTIQLRQGFWRGRSHIDIGDTVTLILRLGKELLVDKYRVAEIAVDIDDNNNEDVTISLGRLPTSADPRSKRAPLTRLVRYLKNYSPPPGAMDVVRPDDD